MQDLIKIMYNIITSMKNEFYCVVFVKCRIF